MGVAECLVDRKMLLPSEAKHRLRDLASEWEDVADTKALKVVQMKGAMTNEIFQITWPTDKENVSRKVILRIYGEGVEVFFDRDDEIRTFEFMSSYGQGPKLLGRFPNGRIEEFINAQTLSASDLRDIDISDRIAAKMREFHDLGMPGKKEAVIWGKLRKWLETAKSVVTPEEADAFRLDAVESEISVLERELSDDQCVGFCHNDLQYGNIMIDGETKTLTIIDYEYSSYNPIAFDIANHFCEMAADYHSDTPHVLDYDKYPGLDERRRFVRVYLSHSGDTPIDAEVDKLLEDVEKYTLVSHLFWGLWGIISEHANEIEFDYMEYARQRFQRYWSTRTTLLSSSDSPL